MELKEILEFEDKLRKITIMEMKDKEFMAELSRFYVLLGDIVISIKLPTGSRIIIPHNEVTLLDQRKERLVINKKIKENRENRIRNEKEAKFKDALNNFEKEHSKNEEPKKEEVEYL